MLRALIRPVGIAAAMLLACLGLVLTVDAPASAACTCKQGQLDQQVKRADVIFVGTIDNTSTAGTDQTYDITASRAYQGTPERSTQVVRPPAARTPAVSGSSGSA